MGCCAGKLQFHKETKRQDKNEYLAAARAVETGAAAGHRVDSSNYDPSLSWALGCQVVALNCQAKDSDEQLYVNYGKFLANGRCGYILKPEYLRGENCGAYAAKAI